MFIRTKSWFNASCPATNLQLKRTQTRLPARNGEGAVKLQTTKPKSVPQQNPLPQTYSIQFWAHHTVGPQEGASIFTLLVSCQFPWSLIFKILFCYVQQHSLSSRKNLESSFICLKRKRTKGRGVALLTHLLTSSQETQQLQRAHSESWCPRSGAAAFLQHLSWYRTPRK